MKKKRYPNEDRCPWKDRSWLIDHYQSDLQPASCPTCKRTDHEHLYDKFYLPVARCRGCGLVLSHPRLPPEVIWRRYDASYFWDEYLPSFGVTRENLDLPGLEDRYRDRLDLLSEAAGTRTGRLLEVGSGAGFFLKLAERSGWAVEGLEVSEEAARFSREHLDLDVRQASAEALEAPAECFDAVVMIEVIEHLLDPREALQRIYRAMKPGGVLLITTPNYDALSKYFLGHSWTIVAPQEHLFYFTTKTLTRLLEPLGFQAGFRHDFAGFGVFGTLDPRNTNQPRGARARLFSWLVERYGTGVYRKVQRAERGDTLLCLARK